MGKKVKTQFLDEIVTILQKGMESKDTFDAVFKLLKQTIDFTSATLFIYIDYKDELRVIHQHGENIADLATEIPFDRGMGISSWVSKQMEPVILESLVKSRPGKERRFNSFVSIPLRIGEKLIGVMNMGHEEPGFYKIIEKDDYKTVGTQLSMIVEKMQLRNQLEKKNKLLTETLDELKATQNILIEKERLAAIGEIVVTINHEINNPLTSIIGLAEILEIAFQTGNSRKVSDGLKGILKQAKRIQKVTEQLNNISSSKVNNYVGDTKMISLSDD